MKNTSMKKKIVELSALLAMLWLVACTPENDFADLPKQPQEGEDIESVKVIAHDFEGAENITRTLVEVGNEGATFKWAKNDTIGIFPLNDYQVAFPMSGGAGTKSAEFDGGGWALKPSSQYMAYYPFEYKNRSSKDIPVSYVGQMQKGNGNTAHLGAYDYMATSAATPSQGTVAFDFKHLGVLLQFKLKVPGAANFTSMTIETQEHVFIRNGKFDLTQKNPVIETSDKRTSLSMELSDIKTTAAGQEVIIYMMMAPTDLTGMNYTVRLGNDKGESTEALFTGKAFEAGRAYALSAELSAFEATSLQIADTRGKAIGSEGGTVTLSYLTNTECEFVITEDAKKWITPVDSRTVSLQNASFNIAENTGKENRQGKVTIKSKNSNLAVEYIILQGRPGTYAITENKGNIPIGIISSNREATSEANGLQNLVDNDLNTYFEANTNSQIYIDWEGPYAVAINKISFSLNAGAHGVSWWTFHISTDGEKYDGFGWSIGHPQGSVTGMFNKEIKARSKYYRFIINENHGAPTTQISELGYREDTKADEDIVTFDDLLARATSFTKNNNTPMGNHYDNRHVTTDNDRQWLSTATNEPNLLASASGYTLREYEVNLYPFGEPLPADINQHGIGDCCALAVFAEMAYLFPDFIKSIITDHKDGTYTVAMYDPQGKPVDVTIQSTFLGDDNGIGASSGKDGKANWGTILEKAIMKWNKIYEVNKDLNGIGYEHVAPLFTGEGNSFEITSSSLLPEQLNQAIRISLDERMIVTGGFNIGGLSYNNGPQTITLHAYSFMLSTDWEALFAMRNPWGYNPGGVNGDDGIFNIYNDGHITQTIGLRVIFPGEALKFAVKDLTPYSPPTY